MAFFKKTKFRTEATEILERHDVPCSSLGKSLNNHLFEMCDEALRRNRSPHDAAAMFLLSVATLPPNPYNPMFGDETLLFQASEIARDSHESLQDMINSAIRRAFPSK
uniref:hypothetical protein n=1 Tax=Roseovarius sp. BRH_c41 TaxID=1629709 RepID=UPI0025FAA2F5|nr:hypothetical protein [Roseovarius sp. BRH_c41]